MSLLTLMLLRVGGNAPQFTIPDLSGEMRDLPRLLEGRRALILDFFFLACAPCREGFTVLHRLHERHERDGLAVAAISRGDSLHALRAFSAESGFGFLVLGAADDNPVFRDYRVLAYPTIYLIASTGRIAYRRAGHDAATLQAAVANLGFGP